MTRTSVVISSLSADARWAPPPWRRRRSARLTPTSRRPRPPRDRSTAARSSISVCPSAPRGGGAGRGGAARGAAPARPQTPDRANWYAPPFKVFDNLYWLGTRQHSSWALQTSAGIIIIDTNFAWATEPEIIDGHDQARA